MELLIFKGKVNIYIPIRDLSHRNKHIFLRQGDIMTEKNRYKARQIETLKAIDEIRMIDTSGYEGNPMVERLLADLVAEQKEKIEEFEDTLSQRDQNISSLKVRVAGLEASYNSMRTLSWIRSLIGIILGVSASLTFLGESSLSKIGVLLVIVFIGLFILTCGFSLGREKHEKH